MPSQPDESTCDRVEAVHFSLDAALRVAMLRACRAPASTLTVARLVHEDTGVIVTPRSAGGMLARLHRAGWLTYNWQEGDSRHELTVAGREVLHLIGGTSL